MKKTIVLFVELKIAAKNKYICDITEKLFENNISVTVFADGAKTIGQLDNLMWTWKQESFIPHSIVAENNAHTDPVLLCPSAEALPETEAILLFDPLPISALEKYKLVFDFAETYHSDKKAASRARFKELRESDKFDLHFTQLGVILAKKSINLETVG